MPTLRPDRHADHDFIVGMGAVHIPLWNKNIFVEFIVVWNDKAKVFVLFKTADQLAPATFQHFDNFTFCPAVFGGCQEAYFHTVHVQSAV